MSSDLSHLTVQIVVLDVVNIRKIPCDLARGGRFVITIRFRGSLNGTGELGDTSEEQQGP